MKHIFLCIFVILIVMVTGCGDKDTVAFKNDASLYKDSLIEIPKIINTLEINIDSANLQIYFWNKKEIKFEAKHIIRDNKTNKELEKQLKKYSITSEEQENKFLFNINYKGNIKTNKDIYTDLKLMIPRQIQKINICQQLGNLIIEDKFEGDISAQLESVNSEIKALKGQLLFECETGNFRLNSGKLSDGSYIDINSGSIYVKSDCQEKSKYSFQTQTGNVELNFPVNSNILLESFGTVQNNQFTGIEGNIKIKTSTKMGKISVNGY